MSAWRTVRIQQFEQPLGFLADHPEQAVFFRRQKVIACLFEIDCVTTAGAAPAALTAAPGLTADRMAEGRQQVKVDL